MARAFSVHPSIDREQRDGSANQVRGGGLDPGPTAVREPTSQTASGGRGDARHRRQLQRSHVFALPVQRHQTVSAQHLGLSQTNQQLTAAGTPVALLDRTDPAVEHVDHVELVDELRECSDTRGRGQRRIRRADPDAPADLRPVILATTYSLHRQGVLPARTINGLNNRDSPSRQGALFVSHADQPAATCGSGSETPTSWLRTSSWPRSPKSSAGCERSAYAPHMTQFITDKKARPVSAIIAVLVAVLTLGYMLPWMIAALRGKSNHWGVFWLNLLLGWTILGWVAAFVMSVLPHRIAGYVR